jgi:hypothetical protein
MYQPLYLRQRRRTADIRILRYLTQPTAMPGFLDPKEARLPRELMLKIKYNTP